MTELPATKWQKFWYKAGRTAPWLLIAVPWLGLAWLAGWVLTVVVECIKDTFYQ